jgi:hypothetical protein
MTMPERLEKERHALPPGPCLDVDSHGRRIVLEAADVIQLDIEGVARMLRAFGAEPIEESPDGVVVLDTAGEYRYRLLQQDRRHRRIGIYERVR